VNTVCCGFVSWLAGRIAGKEKPDHDTDPAHVESILLSISYFRTIIFRVYTSPPAFKVYR